VRFALSVSMTIAVWATGTAHAQEHADAEEARALYLAARFREAVEAFESVLTRPDVDVRGAADAHAHLAMLRHTLGEPERSRAHAEAAVALVPDVAAPEGAAEEVLRELDGARARLGGAARLVLEVEPARGDRTPRRVRARLAPAPAALGLALGLRCGEAEARGAPPTVEVALVVSDRVVSCEAAARSAGGAVWFSLRRDVAPDAALRVDAGEPSASPWPWIALGVGAAAIAGVVIALVVSSSSDGNPVITATQIDGIGW
jgi:hypothetical protein